MDMNKDIAIDQANNQLAYLTRLHLTRKCKLIVRRSNSEDKHFYLRFPSVLQRHTINVGI